MTKTAEYSHRRTNRHAEIYKELNEILPDGAGFDSGTVSRAINEYLRELPVYERQLFLARYYCGMGCDEAAMACGTDVSTLAEELAKIRRGLKSYIEGSVPVYERE